MGTIFCVGDIMIQLFPRDPDVQLQDTLYFKKEIGGGAAVSAYSVACLGGRSAFIGNICSDGFGNYLRYVLKSAGVSLADTAVGGNDTPIILVRGLKNGNYARIYQAEFAYTGEEKFPSFHVSKQDLIHLAPQYLSPDNVKSIRQIIDNAVLKNCRLSVNLDDWFTDAKEMKEIYTLVREEIEKFSFVFLSEQILDRVEKWIPEHDIEKIFKKADVFISFKKDGRIFLYQNDEKLKELSLPSIPMVNAVNLQAVFAGAFLKRCMASLTEECD